MKKTNIEVEGGELLLQSEEGHYAVIPAKHRQEVMDMVNGKCDGCINAYIQSLPKESDYAEDGSLLFDNYSQKQPTVNTRYGTYLNVPELKSEVLIKEHLKRLRSSNDYQDTDLNKEFHISPNRYASESESIQIKNDATDLKPVLDLDIIKNKTPEEARKFFQENNPVIKQDNRSNYQKKVDGEYTDEVFNPSITTQLGEIPQKILRWANSPSKMAGDLINSIMPKSALAKELPNTNKDVFEYRKEILDPNKTFTEKIGHSIKTGTDLASGGLLNIGMLEFGNLTPLSRIPKYAKIFEIGSSANNAVNIIGVGKNVTKMLNDGDVSDMDNLLDFGANILGLAVKSGNLDTADAFNTLTDPNFRVIFNNWTSSQKKDFISGLFKDATAHSLNFNDQQNRSKNEKD